MNVQRIGRGVVAVPMVACIYIAFGAFYAARRKCIASKVFKRDE